MAGAFNHAATVNTLTPANAHTATCHGRLAEATVRMGGAVRTTRGTAAGPRGSRRQARRNTKVPFVPPKPKLFLTATSMRISRASWAQ